MAKVNFVAATRPEIKEAKPVRKIRVGRLSSNVTEDHLLEIFEQFGTVKKVVIQRSGGVMDRFNFNEAFIEFSTPEEALNAMRNVDGGHIDGHQVTASLVSRRSKSPVRSRSRMGSKTDSRRVPRNSSPPVMKKRRIVLDQYEWLPPRIPSFPERGGSPKLEVLPSSPSRRRKRTRHSSSFSENLISGDTKPRKLSPRVINYIRGDATDPVGTGNRIIAHICNNAGGWGKGFVVAISRKWSLPEREYRRLKAPIDLGRVQFVPVTEDVTIANMVAQTSPADAIPIRYDALRTSLKEVAERALELGASVHMPKIGTGLSRGSWDKISQIILEELVHAVVPVFVYLFE